MARPVFASVGSTAKLVLAAAAVLLIAAARPVPAMQPAGYAGLADRVLTAYRLPLNSSILISASFVGEARFIAEMAVREPRPEHWLLRATKILRRRTGTSNRQTELVHTTKEQMLKYFEALPVNLVVLAHDGDADQAPQHDYLAQMIAANTARFTRVWTAPVGGGCHDAPCTIDVYRFQNTNPGAPFDPRLLPENMPLWQGL
jgi:hypothetical protein